jgi:hypothetical protein
MTSRRTRVSSSSYPYVLIARRHVSVSSSIGTVTSGADSFGVDGGDSFLPNSAAGTTTRPEGSLVDDVESPRLLGTTRDFVVAIRGRRATRALEESAGDARAVQPLIIDAEGPSGSDARRR